MLKKARTFLGAFISKEIAVFQFDIKISFQKLYNNNFIDKAKYLDNKVKFNFN